MEPDVITDMARRLHCPRAEHPRYAADCVVRAILADHSLAPPPPWRIEAGIGTLECTMERGLELTGASRLRLGDAAHAVAHPVAVAIDAVAGTNLRNCSACEERRRRWNRLWSSDTPKQA